MAYISLSKIYYKDEKEWLSAYNQRFNSFGTIHFGININQYQRKHSFEAFLCYADDILTLIQNIYNLKAELLLLKSKLTDVVRDQYILKCITEEIKSTNDIEGVRSTKKEIRAWLDKLPATERVPHLQSVIEKYSLISKKEEISFNSCQDIRDFYGGFALQEVLEDDRENLPDGAIFRKGQVDIQSGVIVYSRRFTTPLRRN